MPRPETFAPSQRSRGRRIFSKWWCCWENSTRHRCRTRRTSIIDKFRKSRYGEMVVLILSFPFKRGAWPPFPSTISIKTGSAANGRCPLPTEPRAPTSPPRSVSGEDRGPCHGIRRGNGEKFYAPITRSLDPLSQYHTNLQEAVPILPQLGKKRGIPVSCVRLPLPLDRQCRSLRCPQHIRRIVVPTFLRGLKA